MSKYVKDLIARDLAQRLEGVTDALLVNVIGLDVNQTVVLRKALRDRNINLMVVKNSLAKRATEGTPLAPAFEGVEGTLAVVWGGDDFVSLVKEIERLDQDGQYEAFTTRGGVMDGQPLTPERIRQISTWPNRREQLGILAAQILAPGANLLGQLNAPAGALASQIKKRSEA